MNIELSANSEATSLEDLIDAHFSEEEIEGYNCIKCSLREYLSEFLDDFDKQNPIWKNIDDKDQDFKAALSFFLEIYHTQDVDEEEFIKKFKTFKEET